MVHIYNRILLGHEIRPFTATWMQLEIIILSKSDRERQMPYDITYMWNLKYDTNKLTYWRRKWQPTPVFLPGEFHGQRSLAGYIVHEIAELDMTEQYQTYL